jgi:hypothetical protein
MFARPCRTEESPKMDEREVRSDPEDQRRRGLTPDEQRAEREQESQEAETTKFEQLKESQEEETRRAAEALATDPVLEDSPEQ